MEDTEIEGQYNNVIIKEENSNECVYLVHYEDESGATHCEQSNLDNETFSKIASALNGLSNEETPSNENQVVITLQEDSFPPVESNYNSTVTYANFHDHVEATNAVGTISESEGLLLSEVLRHYNNTPTVKSSDYLAYKLINHDSLSLNEHEHGLEKPFKCMKCEKSFTQKPNLQRHMSTHRGEKDFVCPVCQKSFTQKSNLQRHMRVHAIDGDELPYFACPDCDYRCAQKSNLVRHQLTHKDVRRYKCQECGTKFSQKVNLFKHMLLHTGERPFKCIQCEGAFISKTDLIKHERIAHTGEKPFSCTLCNKSFVIKHGLDSHIRNVHTDKREFSCMLCAYEGKSEHSLELHIMNQHTDEKPHKCNLCDFKTTYTSSLRNHIKLHNALQEDNTRPMRYCPLSTCEYKTISKTDYVKHLRSHGIGRNSSKKQKEPKIYSCDFCSYAAPVKCRLEMHIINKHTDKPLVKEEVIHEMHESTIGLI
ncbi:unnamed protein product, partial [Meganyctiphanes norvegica]